MATKEEEVLQILDEAEKAKKMSLDLANTDGLQSIALTQEYLSQIKQNLGDIIDSMQENPSLISRAAAYWGELPFWQKVVGGAAVSGPSLLLGAMTCTFFLATISGAGVLLDDHHHHNNRLKEGVFGIADGLSLTIGSLDGIRQKLATEIEKFREENTKLAENITHLNGEIKKLSVQTDMLIATEQLLRKNKEDLEKIAGTLKQNLEQQGDLFEKNQRELAEVKELHHQSIEQLAKKSAELAQVRESMEAQVNNAKAVASTLEDTVKLLSTTAINDAEQRNIFQEKLTHFLSDQTRNFSEVCERISKKESELSAAKLELQANNEHYKQLLQRQEKQILRLESINQSIQTEPPPVPAQAGEAIRTGELLNTFGLMASVSSGKNTAAPPESEQNVMRNN